MALRHLMRWGREVTPRQAPESRSASALQRDINALFEEFSRGWMSGWAGNHAERVGTFTPRIEVRETAQAVQVTAELPGLHEKDISLSLSARGDVLHLSGEKKQESSQERHGVMHTERYYGRFSRDIALPNAVQADAQGLAAVFKNGVLHVSLPKRQAPQASQPKRIQVRVH